MEKIKPKQRAERMLQKKFTSALKWIMQDYVDALHENMQYVYLYDYIIVQPSFGGKFFKTFVRFRLQGEIDRGLDIVHVLRLPRVYSADYLDDVN